MSRLSILTLKWSILFLILVSSIAKGQTRGGQFSALRMPGSSTNVAPSPYYVTVTNYRAMSYIAIDARTQEPVEAELIIARADGSIIRSKYFQTNRLLTLKTEDVPHGYYTITVLIGGTVAKQVRILL